MAKRKLKRWRDSDLKELYRRLDELSIEYMKTMSLIKAGGSIENPSRVKHLRREKARLLTIITEKERESSG